MSKETFAIAPRRDEDYPEWYQQVIKAADMAENSPVRGCMVIKPWGYGIWEILKEYLDRKIKETGHENAYFPLFIPVSYLEKEAKHVEGFAKECAVITHHRLEEKGGKLIPAAPLEEPLIVRPTSETIIGETFSRWVSSYRDLPLLINQWANVVRWEMRPRIFLRTTEFLWQEGHTVHANEKEAIEEANKMLQVYRTFLEEVCAIPVIVGEKSESERFPGAVVTYTLEAMMQDRKALQACTSHYLGQNFSKAFDIKFSTQEGALEHGYTTSWGITTRIIGALIMCHGDDNGLVLPPRAAPKQVVIIPFLPNDQDQQEVLKEAERIKTHLESIAYHGKKVEVIVDRREKRFGDKKWDWVKKGIPLRIEIGPKDLKKGTFLLSRRDKDPSEKQEMSLSSLEGSLSSLLDEMQKEIFQKAKAYQKEHTHTEIKTFEEFKAFFQPSKGSEQSIHGGFVKAKWCLDQESEKLLEELKVTVRCLPLNQSNTQGTCVLTGKPATVDAIFAKAY